jgi:hypothetical protein
MKLLLAALLLFTANAVGHATPTREEALSAIAVIEKDILSVSAIEAARTISQFTEESEEVMLVIGPDTIPWVMEERKRDQTDDTIYAMLLAAYFAGNAKAQLRAGKAGDDPYPGWLAAIKAYRQFQTKRSLVIPSLEKFSEMEADGSLEAHARDVKSQEKKEPDEPPRKKPSSSRDFI